MDADLEHHAARHSGGLVTPRTQVNLAETIAADVGFGVDQLAEESFVDLALDPAELAFPAALIAQGQDHARLAADLGDPAAGGNRVGDGFVEKDMLAGIGRRARGLAMDAIWRGIDDGLCV